MIKGWCLVNELKIRLIDFTSPCSYKSYIYLAVLLTGGENKVHKNLVCQKPTKAYCIAHSFFTTGI